MTKHSEHIAPFHFECLERLITSMRSDVDSYWFVFCFINEWILQATKGCWSPSPNIFIRIATWHSTTRDKWENKERRSVFLFFIHNFSFNKYFFFLFCFVSYDTIIVSSLVTNSFSEWTKKQTLFNLLFEKQSNCVLNNLNNQYNSNKKVF